MKKISFVIISLFIALFSLSFGIDESKADSVCDNPIPGTFLYDNCPLTVPADCTTLDGTIDAICVAPGWDCTTPSCPAVCDFGGPGCAGTICINEFEACGCSCAGIPALPSGGGPLLACIPGPADADLDGDDCDYDLGENMFNCPVDCLPFGIPDKTIEDVLSDTISWIVGIAVAISIVMLIWGGLNYVGSSGDTEKAKTAKKIIVFALLGIVITGASYAIIILLDTLFS